MSDARIAARLRESFRWQCAGVGAYTGAAMASIAAGQPVAAVDANVMRILSRLRCLDWEFKCVKQYSQIAEQLVDPNRPGDLNQVAIAVKQRFRESQVVIEHTVHSFYLPRLLSSSGADHLQKCKSIATLSTLLLTVSSS